jgi:hypothetical protein
MDANYPLRITYLKFLVTVLSSVRSKTALKACNQFRSCPAARGSGIIEKQERKEFFKALFPNIIAIFIECRAMAPMSCTFQIEHSYSRLHRVLGSMVVARSSHEQYFATAAKQHSFPLVPNWSLHFSPSGD